MGEEKYEPDMVLPTKVPLMIPETEQAPPSHQWGAVRHHVRKTHVPPMFQDSDGHILSKGKKKKKKKKKKGSKTKKKKGALEHETDAEAKDPAEQAEVQNMASAVLAAAKHLDKAKKKKERPKTKKAKKDLAGASSTAQ